MPKELKHYQCDYCGSVYADEDSAIACEASHVHAKTVYEEHYRRQCCIPHRIAVKMDDGSLIQYILVTEVSV